MKVLNLLLAQLAVASGLSQLDSSVVSNDQSKLATSTRRGWLTSAASIVAATPFLAPMTAGAAEVAPAQLSDYKDADCKFFIKVPSGWEYSVQELPDRRKIVLYLEPNSNRKTLFFIAYTPVRDDFTSLGSFGSVDQVGQSTILPKGEIMGEDNESVMLSAESKQSAYMFDYKQKVPGQPETHLRTIFSLVTGATGGAGSVLVSITAQCPEVDYPQFKPVFDEIINSYRPK